MSDEVKLLPCPFCETEMHQHKHCFSHPRPAKGDCLLRDYSFDNIKADEWNTRPPIGTDEVVERVARAIWTTSQDHIVGNHGTYALKMRMSWDEAQRAAARAIAAMKDAASD